MNDAMKGERAEPAGGAEPALLTAVKWGSLRRLESLLASGVNPDSAQMGGPAALEHAALDGRRDLVEALLDSGVTIPIGLYERVAAELERSRLEHCTRRESLGEG